MVNLENQGMMTEFDAVHGISTIGSLLINLCSSEVFLYLYSSIFFPTFITLGLFKPFIDFLKLSNYSDLQNYIKKIGYFTLLFEVKEIL